MTSNGEIHKTNGVSSGALVLKDLQSLLRESIGKDVIVIDHTEDELIQSGENFAGTLLKVDARIKRTKNSPEEKLALVAKMNPTGDFQNENLNSTVTFRKEIFFFQKLLPAYRQLGRDVGLEENELFDDLPKFYGGRLSLSEKTPEVADGDAVLLMENLKVKGYRTMDKMSGLSYDYAKLAISKLAKFHALGIVAKLKRSKIFEEAKEPLSGIAFNIDIDKFKVSIDHIVDLVCQEPRIARYETRVRRAIEATNNGMDFIMKTNAVKPWISILHFDYWVANTMFNDAPDDVKFIDFQLSKIGSPMMELPYFLFGSCQADVVEHRLDDLLDVYHASLIETLRVHRCDTAPFAREHFDEQLKADAFSQFFRCFFALKFYTFEPDETTNWDDVIGSLLMSGANSQFYERSWRCVSKYIEKNWI